MQMPVMTDPFPGLTVTFHYRKPDLPINDKSENLLVTNMTRAAGAGWDGGAAGAAPVPLIVRGRWQHRSMSIPTVHAAINDLMDWGWHAVYELLAARGLLGDGLAVEEYTGLMSWVEGPTRYTVVHSAAVAVLFMDTDPVDAVVFHRDLLGSEDPKSFFSLGPRG